MTRACPFAGTRTNKPAPGRSTWLAASALTIAALVAACGDDNDDGAVAAEDLPAAADPSRSPAELDDPATATDAIEEERGAVIEAHLAAMNARIDSAAPPTPDPDHPAVAETHTDPMLEEWTGRLRGLASQGLAIRYPDASELSVDVLDVSFSWQTAEDGSTDAGTAEDGRVGDQATLQACIVDDGETVRVASGEVTHGGGIFTIHETAVLHLSDGVWKLAERRANAEWPGRAGCAA